MNTQKQRAAVKSSPKRFLVEPPVTVKHNQLWFWTKRWQAEEQKVQEDFRKGRMKASKTAKEFLDELDQ